MALPQEFMDMVSKDILQIEKASESSHRERFQLHRELDGRYQSCIKNWSLGFWCTLRGNGYVCYSTLQWDEGGVLDNLLMMKAKLETFRFQLNAIAPEQTSQKINVTTNVNVSITFEQVRSKIEDMDTLTDQQIKEAKGKVSEIESVIKDRGRKKTKWEKIRPSLTWLADKSFDVAMTILPLFLQV